MTSPTKQKRPMLAFALAWTTAMVALPSLQAQTYRVIHTFSEQGDGYWPITGLTLDRAGNLYGTADGGSGGYGVVFKMTHTNGGWTLKPLHSFSGPPDGEGLESPVLLGPSGALYGSTNAGGYDYCFGGVGCGTIFELRPPPTACTTAVCPWNQTMLYDFSGGTDGASPSGEVALDQAGNIYGETFAGGFGCEFSDGCGTLFKLSPSNGSWIKSSLYQFTGGSDGEGPSGGVVLDTAGNLYGTAIAGGRAGSGTVFQLTHPGSNWVINVLYSFSGGADGQQPAGVVLDTAGNVYGATTHGGSGNGGTVFELIRSNGLWTFDLLYSFTGTFGPRASLTLDASENIYGTTYADGIYGYGSVFKLSRGSNGWIYSDLHDFTGGVDGGNPSSTVIVDGNGNLYGTAAYGGGTGCDGRGCGVVWEITP